MQRMGLDGRQPQTYQQIALEHDISRERVRGIVEKLKNTGQLPVYRLRLDPLIGLCPNCARQGQTFPNSSKRNQKYDEKFK